MSPGETVFQNTCKVCHGANAIGITGLGKPLRNSAYVQASDDKELFRNIAEGRFPDDPLNTTGIMMPARGAQNITDEQINDVVIYLRSIQDSSQPTADISAWIKAKPEAVEIVIDSVGRDLFVASCSACHGPNGEGMEGLGKPFTTSVFVRDSTDKEIITMVKMGRPVWDAANTTGVDMPPKGGNPAITDDELYEIIAYIRSISTLIIEAKEAAIGRDLFVASCSACHGPNGEGMEGLGKPFTTSEFVKNSTDKEVITMIKMGRPVWDAANTTGVDMPPKGGNPAISDDDLNEIITYIRSISTIED
jgi:disulfide bond formation protein DsbB